MSVLDAASCDVACRARLRPDGELPHAPVITDITVVTEGCLLRAPKSEQGMVRVLRADLNCSAGFRVLRAIGVTVGWGASQVSSRCPQRGTV